MRQRAYDSNTLSAIDQGIEYAETFSLKIGVDIQNRLVNMIILFANLDVSQKIIIKISNDGNRRASVLD